MRYVVQINRFKPVLHVCLCESLYFQAGIVAYDAVHAHYHEEGEKPIGPSMVKDYITHYELCDIATSIMMATLSVRMWSLGRQGQSDISPGRGGQTRRRQRKISNQSVPQPAA